MRIRILTIILVVVTLLPVAATGEYRCHIDDEILVEISEHSSQDVMKVCAAAEKAVNFLRHYNLSPRRPITINIIEDAIVSEGYDAFGSYDIRSEIVSLMSYQAILKHVENPEMYGEAFDDIHYAGAVAHEVAHAVMQHNLLSKHISQAPQEYLAHATQLAVMPEARRRTLIANMDVGPWEPGDAISDIYMALEPGKFAVKSYLHLTTTNRPQDFIRLLLKSNWFYVYVP